MSLLLDRTPRSSSAAPAPGSFGGLVGSGAFAAVRAAAASMVPALLPVVLAWVTVPSGAGWFDAARVGLAAWLLAHHGGLLLADGRFELVPLGLTLVPALACWLAARRLARHLDPKSAAVEAGVSRARPAALPGPALGGFVVGYLAVVLLVALAAGWPPVRPVTGQALLGALVISLVCGGWGAAAYRAGGAVAGLRLLLDRVPPVLVRGAALGLCAVAALLAAATVLLGVAVVAGFSQVLEVHRALAPGVAGTAVLLVLQAVYLPNLVVWAAAFLAGPGFSVGVATSVTPRETVIGPLPGLPVLGALPSPGAEPRWMALVVLLPVVAGAVAGVVAARRRPEVALTGLALDGALAAAGAGGLMLLLAWLSAGPAGPGRLELVGPVPWLTGAAVAAEVLVGAWAGIGLWRAAELVAGDR